MAQTRRDPSPRPRPRSAGPARHQGQGAARPTGRHASSAQGRGQSQQPVRNQRAAQPRRDAQGTVAAPDRRSGRSARPAAGPSRTAGVTRRLDHVTRQAGRPGRSRQDGRVNLRVALVAVAAFLVLAVAVISGIIAHSTAKSQVDNPGATISVTIPDGATTTDIGQILEDAGVVANRSQFTDAVKRADAATSMKSGNYDLVAGSDIDGIVQQLVSGPNSTADKVTVAEGLTVAKTADAVQDALGIPASDFVDQAKASNYVADYPFLQVAQDDSLEGFLFPKTYDCANKDKSADTVIRAMLDQYQAEVASIDMSQAKQALQDKYGVAMSDYDILKLASIIEKEALNDDDRYKIASVMYNRMKAGMYLQSDATMSYVTGGDVTAQDLKTDSPYNTYLHQGLTPTPICTPSLKSIDAALHPADTAYYYFWITDSEHVFSETYDQHQQAIDKARATGEDAGSATN